MALLPSSTNAIISLCKPSKKLGLDQANLPPVNPGNPGGRPKDEHRVAELARSYTLEAIDTLVELMRDGQG